MHGFALFFLLFLLGRKGSSSPTLSQAANAAQADAKAKTDLAMATGHPHHHRAAKQAQVKAATLSHAVKQASAPAPWPQAMPNGLPPFPSGWVPDNPPSQAVQARAWQLLPQLWKQGPNARKTEQTSGRWTTYVAQAMGKKKGVVAYKMRPGAEMPPQSLPSGPQANA